ncbi:unnamed protein product [Ixodes persulcatus]
MVQNACRKRTVEARRQQLRVQLWPPVNTPYRCTSLRSPNHPHFTKQIVWLSEGSAGGFCANSFHNIYVPP